ncbi:hypothetical protein QQ045_017654 [Rhodiola kirilowii]
MEALSRRTFFFISPLRRSISPTLNIQIAQFSTYQSSSHYHYRRHEEEARSVRVSVWWDVETCNLPVGLSAYRISHSITAALRANGIKGPLQISAFGNVFKLPKGTQEALSSTGITLTHVLTDGAGGKNSVNRSMIIELMYWVSQHPPPAHIFMISADHDMASTLHRLRMSNYNILLAAPEETSTALCSAASIMWQWNNLVKGENLAGRHFNQPPDGPNGSWYGTYRVPLESPFPAVEQPMPTRDSEPAESETENTHGIPTEVTEQIRQILTTYPKGVSISVLRKELNSTMIVDKKLHGYKNFSNLLLALPQILELHEQKDGQYLVCAINPKSHVSTDSPTKASESYIAGNTNHKKTPTQIELGDNSSSLKSTDQVSTLNCVTPNEKYKPVDQENPSPAICNEQLSLEGACQSPPTNEEDAVAKSSQGSAAIKKQVNASDDGIFQRTWAKWLGGSNDGAVVREGNHSVQYGPSFHSSSHSCDTALEENEEISEKIGGEGGKIQNFCGRLLNWLKTYISGTEPAAAGSYSSNTSSQVVEHSLSDNAFSKDGLWTEMKSFLCTPDGENVISKSISRPQMARELKNQGPSVLSSYGDDDILYLVNLLIDDKKWIKESPSKTSPFKVICTSVSSLDNFCDPGAMSSTLSDEPQQSDLQKERECDRKLTNHPTLLASMKYQEERKTQMLADCQNLLDAIVKSHPGGYNLASFKKLFFQRYCYGLDLKSLKFDKLASLIDTMSGVKLKGTTIYPNVNSSSTPRSSDINQNGDIKRIGPHIDSDNEISAPSTHSDCSDSQFDEQLGPVQSLNRDIASSSSGNPKPKTNKKLHDLYEPCVEEDIYTDSDGEIPITEEQAKGSSVPEVHNKVSSLIDILSNWETKKYDARKNNLAETAVKDSLQNPIKPYSSAELSKKSSRSIVHKSKPQRAFNFVLDDHRKEVDLKSTSEPRQQQQC